MLGVDDRLVTPATLKWVKVGLLAGLATIPTTIVLYYVLGLTVDAALAGTNQIRDWLFVLTFLVLLKAGLAISLGSPVLRREVALVLGATAATGIAALWLG